MTFGGAANGQASSASRVVPIEWCQSSCSQFPPGEIRNQNLLIEMILIDILLESSGSKDSLVVFLIEILV